MQWKSALALYLALPLLCSSLFSCVSNPFIVFDMKYLLIAILALLGIATMGSCSNQKSTRDLVFEAYCDSIWDANPEYYMDVLAESDEYQDYVTTNGFWW